MDYYDKVLEPSYAETQYANANPLDDDVKQTALLRTFSAFVNRGGKAEDFEDFCRSTGGAGYLKKSVNFSYLDLLKSSYMTKLKPKKDNDMYDGSTAMPISTSLPSTLKLLDDSARERDTDVSRAHKSLEVHDQLRSLYASADDAKKQAMDLMVEAMEFKDGGKPVPSRIRMALSRLRDEIQKTDQRWKLDLNLL